jgi:hypothetical protein
MVNMLPQMKVMATRARSAFMDLDSFIRACHPVGRIEFLDPEILRHGVHQRSIAVKDQSLDITGHLQHSHKGRSILPGF